VIIPIGCDTERRRSEDSMPDLNEPVRLNPAQQQVTDLLGAKAQDRPTFRDDLRDHLRHELEAALKPYVAEVTDLPLFVSKHDLTVLHGCEARWVAEAEAEFEWSIPLVRGSVTHKAIEMLVTWRGDPHPLDLVEHALARMEHEDGSRADFISSLSERERAELSGEVNNLVALFMETFPPLKRRWRPVAESRVRAELCDDTLTLQGKVDLSLGSPDGNRAGKVLIDLKTGRPHPSHIDDLRFYALLETLRVGIPPRLLANYYLEAGDPRTEAVTEDLLWSTLARLVDAVRLMTELVDPGPRTPVKTPNPTCRWCPALNHCQEGARYLNADDDDDTTELGSVSIDDGYDPDLGW